MPQRWTDLDGTAHDTGRFVVFVGQGLLGEFPWDAGDHPENRWHRGGWAFFCRECGEVWGRLVLISSAERVMFLEPVCVACDKHWDQWNIPGSMLQQVGAAIEVLPEEMIRREFILHMKHYEEESES